MPGPLHWSFDYAQHHMSGVDFAAKITEILCTESVTSGELCYAILPNYPFNHTDPTIRSTEDLIIGELRLARRQTSEGDWQYEAMQFDSSSGEKLQLQFTTENDDCRRLKGEWKLSAEYEREESYQQYSCTGSLVHTENHTKALLRPSRSCTLEAGEVDAGTPIISEYSLFDTLPIIGRQFDRYGEIALLEKLERLLPHQRIGLIQEEFRLRLADVDRRLHGYYLYGTANPPSYWWIDDQMKVAIMTTTLLTYVRKSG